MTTIELWTALDWGEIQAYVRVWREGMECWTPAGEVPELACALVNAPPHGHAGAPRGGGDGGSDDRFRRCGCRRRSRRRLRGPAGGAGGAAARPRGPFWMGLGTAAAVLAIAVAFR